MSKIVISRKQEWSNRLRQAGIYLDGQKIGAVSNGEVKTFDVPDGNHSIKARIAWYGSREIDFLISGEEKKYFQLSGFKYSNILMPVALVLFVASIVLRRILHIEIAAWLLIPVILIFLYYLTLGRNDYLVLKQTESW